MLQTFTSRLHLFARTRVDFQTNRGRRRHNRAAEDGEPPGGEGQGGRLPLPLRLALTFVPGGRPSSDLLRAMTLFKFHAKPQETEDTNEYTLYTRFVRPDPTRIIFSRTGIAMSHAFLGRITRPYSDISGLLISWSLECERMWVYEHEADEEVNRTHCHFLVVNCQKDFDTLKERKSWTNFGFKGNKDSSFKHYDPKYEYSKVTYMSKGNLDPVFSKNDNGIAAECKGKYVDYKKDRALQYIVEEKPKFNADEF